MQENSQPPGEGKDTGRLIKIVVWKLVSIIRCDSCFSGKLLPLLQHRRLHVSWLTHSLDPTCYNHESLQKNLTGFGAQVNACSPLPREEDKASSGGRRRQLLACSGSSASPLFAPQEL